MRDESKYFIQEHKLRQELDKIHKANHIRFENYFKNSGKIEQVTEGVEAWHKYKMQKRVHGVFLEVIDEQKVKQQSKYEKYLKSLEVDLNKYIKRDDKENW